MWHFCIHTCVLICMLLPLLQTAMYKSPIVMSVFLKAQLTYSARIGKVISLPQVLQFNI